jgi:tetratricopeptide (TPR) repeat protein
MIISATDPTQLRALNTQKFEVLSGRYSEYYHLGEVVEGNEDAKALLELSREISDEPTWLIDALLRQPEITQADQKEYLDPGLAMAEQALGLAKNIGDRHRQLFALIARARLLQIRGEKTSFDSAYEALGLARELGDLETETRLLIGIAAGYGMENIQKSKELLDQAVVLSRKLNNKRVELELLSALGSEYERNGDYYHLLTQFEEKRLAICREIGDKLTEGFVLMYVAQIQGLYLGDYDTALKTIYDAFKLTKKVAGSLYPLLRLVQLQAKMGLFPEAAGSLVMALPLSERNAFDIGRAGYNLVGAILSNEKGDEAGYRAALGFSDEVRELAESQKVSRQYLVASFCESSTAHLGLARLTEDLVEKEKHRQEALSCSEAAYRVFQEYGFIQIIECSTEEVAFRRAQALVENSREAEAEEFFHKAYEETMRKHDLIPSGSHYRKTFLNNIALHRQIKLAHGAR